uniref:Uncharacterized protein n=1 Tax=Strombidium rassoulzadegani TaxID=1082188 RepID=A0A7S3CME7_9SPIT|mmetsp:Transcript_14855/g.25286  ORF Transcript_14855/g.25286 Transcript_14855/m.25286 type:complete len:251 (+) Transcript_14855:1440-2192(+)
MLPLGSLPLLLVKGANTLLEAQKRLVDFGALGLPVLVIALAVLGALTASQVDEEELAALLHALLLDLDLSDGVGATRGVVGLRGVRRPHLVTLLYQLKNLVVVVHELLSQPRDLDSVVFVLAQAQLLMVVEQIVELAAVDLVHGDGDSEISLMILPVVDAPFEQVFNRYALDAVHGVGLARARLPVSEDGHHALVEDEVEYGAHLEEVELLVRLEGVECIVEFELRVFDCFGHAVDFKSAVVNNDLGVAH